MARRFDRRVVRTRKLLREALLSAILEDGYDAISIQDITDKANLGRATFYLHFKDKDELLLDVVDQLLSDFLSQTPQFTQDQWQMNDPKPITMLFDFASEHYDLYRILKISSGGITAARQLHTTIGEKIKSCIQNDIEEFNTIPQVPIDFIANHFAGSLLATIFWWLDNDLPYTIDQMATMFQQVSKLDREALMGRAPQDESHLEKSKPKRKKREKAQSKHKRQEVAAVIETVPEVEIDEMKEPTEL